MTDSNGNILLEEKIKEERSSAALKAWQALSAYKFWMFGYHAGRWVNYNNLLKERDPNPFKDIVALARRKVDELDGQLKI